MRKLADRVSLRTGLSRAECDGIIKILVHEIILELRSTDEVTVSGLGKIRRYSMSGNQRRLLVKLTIEAMRRLTAPYKEEELPDEISFE